MSKVIAQGSATSRQGSTSEPSKFSQPAKPSVPRPRSGLETSEGGGGGALQSFVLQTLDLMGSAVDVVEWGVYDVLLPHEPVKRITFDPEVAQEREDCELVALGTPFLEAMIEVAKSHGQLQVRRIEARAEAPQNLDEKLANLVHFVKCKPPKAIRTWSEEGLLLLCQLHVTYHADEVVEEIVSVLIDLHSLADVTHLMAALDSHWFTVGPPAEGDGHIHGHRHEGANETVNEATSKGAHKATNVPANVPANVAYPALPHSISTPFRLQDGFSRAVQGAQPGIEKQIASIQSQNRAQLQDELAKSRHYYETTLEKLDKQLYGTTDADRKERFRQKIEATKRDRDHRMEDISRAYDVAADVRLHQAILYRVPVACVEAELQQRTEVYPYVFRYYPWASTWSPVVCPVCLQTASRLERGATRDATFWHCGCASKTTSADSAR